MKLNPLIFISLILVAIIIIQFYKPIAENITKIEPIFMLQGFFVILVIIFLKQSKWYMILKQICNTNLKISIATYFPGQLVNEIAPTGVGDLTKAYLIKKCTSIPGGSSISVSYIERAMDILVLSSLAVVTIVFLFSSSLSIYSNILYAVIILLSLIFLLLALIPMRIANIFSTIICFLTRTNIGFIKKLGARANSFITSIASDFQNALKVYKYRKKVLACGVVLSIIDWFLEGLCLLFLIRATGYDIPLLPSVGIVAISWIIGIASMLPGGLGIREAVLSMLYSTINVPFASAFLATIIYRFMIFVCFGVGSLISVQITKNRQIFSTS